MSDAHRTAPGAGPEAGSVPREEDRRALRRRWSTPRLTSLGSVHRVLAGGAAKLSAQFDGDGRKPAGQG